MCVCVWAGRSVYARVYLRVDIKTNIIPSSLLLATSLSPSNSLRVVPLSLSPCARMLTNLARARASSSFKVPSPLLRSQVKQSGRLEGCCCCCWLHNCKVKSCRTALDCCCCCCWPRPYSRNTTAHIYAESSFSLSHSHTHSEPRESLSSWCSVFGPRATVYMYATVCGPPRRIPDAHLSLSLSLSLSFFSDFGPPPSASMTFECAHSRTRYLAFFSARADERQQKIPGEKTGRCMYVCMYTRWPLSYSLTFFGKKKASSRATSHLYNAHHSDKHSKWLFSD